MRRSLISFGLAALIVLIWPATALAVVDPGLGTAGNYAILASAEITDAPADGGSWISGRMGISPGLAAAITGFTTTTPPQCCGTSGPIDAGATSPAGLAKTNLTAAYTNAMNAPCPATNNFTNVNLGGLSAPLVPGVYCQTTEPVTGLSGTLTLNGPGIYIFQEGSTLTTASGSSVVLIGGAQPCDIFWQVGSSATLGSTTAFIGNIMAHDSITMNARATLWGRALAGAGGTGLTTGFVHLHNNRIIQPSGCTTGLTPNYAAPALGSPPNTPTGSTLPRSLGTIFTAVVPGSTGIPEEMRGEFPWLLLIAVGAGLGATALGISSRRRRRRNA
jgi:hypothetical protein